MNKKRMLLFCSIYFIGYVLLAMPYGQYIPYLQEIGYSATQRGMMISAYSVTNILFQILFGYLSDKYNKAKEILILSIILVALSSLFLFSLETQIFILHFLLVALSGGVVNTDFGLFDTWLYTNGEDTVTKFGFIRAFGSFGWAVANLFVAQIVSAVGYKWLGVLILLVSILTVGLISLCKGEKNQGTSTNNMSVKDIKKLFQSKQYLLLVFIMFLFACVTTTSGSVIVDKILYLGGTNRDIGLKWAINGAVEIPLYLFGTAMLSKFGSNKLLTMAGIAVIIQYIFYALADSVPYLLVVSAGQMFTGPLLMLSSRMLFRKYVPQELSATGLLVGLSIYQGISCFIMPTIGGFLTDNVHVNATLYVVVVLAIIGTCLSVVLKRITKG